MFVGYLPDIAKKFKKNEILAKVFGYLYDALDEDSEVFRRISKMQAGETFEVYFDGGIKAIEQAYYTKSPKEAFYESLGFARIPNDLSGHGMQMFIKKK